MMKQKLATMISRIENKEQWDELIAQLNGRLLFIDVHKEWAGPCSIMQGQLENIFLNTEAIESRLQFCSVHEKSGVRTCNSQPIQLPFQHHHPSPLLHHRCTTAAPLLPTSSLLHLCYKLSKILTASHHYTTTTTSVPPLFHLCSTSVPRWNIPLLMNFSMMNPVNLDSFFYSMAMLLQIYMAQWHPNWYVPFMEIYQISIRTIESNQRFSQVA